jgi:glutamate--cysteine ligase
MDVALGGRRYRDAWLAAARVLTQAQQLPSARVLATMATDFDNSYLRSTRAQSVQTRSLLLGLPWTPAQQQHFEAMARDSVLEQRRIEAADTMPFEIYRQEYLAPRRLGVDR